MEDRGDSSAVKSADRHSSQHAAKESWTPAVRWEGGRREQQKKGKSEQGGVKTEEGKEGGQGNDGVERREEALFLQIDVNHRRESRNSVISSTD